MTPSQESDGNVSYVEILGIPIRTLAGGDEGRVSRLEQQVDRLEAAVEGLAGMLEEAGVLDIGGRQS